MNDNSQTDKKLSELQSIDQIPLRHPEYLLEPYLPVGEITLLVGTSGMTKTWLALNFCTLISRGMELFGVQQAPHVSCKAIYLSLENDSSTVVRPRLEMMGANLESIFIPMDNYLSSGLQDTSKIESYIKEIGARLIIFDPIQSFLQGVDFHRANEMRPVLDNLRAVAARTKCSIVLICHLNKRGDAHVLDRIIGSSDIRNQARSILVVGIESDNYIMVHAKNSLGEAGLSLRYHIDGHHGLIMDELCDIDLENLQLNPTKQKKKLPKIQEATQLLEKIFAANDTVEYSKIEELAKECGISKSTLHRAKTKLQVSTIHVGYSSKKETFWHRANPNKTILLQADDEL